MIWWIAGLIVAFVAGAEVGAWMVSRDPWRSDEQKQIARRLLLNIPDRNWLKDTEGHEEDLSEFGRQRLERILRSLQ